MPGPDREGGESHSLPTLQEFAPAWPSDPDVTFRPPDVDEEATGSVAELPRLPEGELEVDATLGEGGMGIVRAARQRSLGRSVAVKQLQSDQRSTRAQQKLLHEAWAVGCLEHPHIVPVYALARDASGMPMMVQKHLVGEAWSVRLRADRRSDGSLPPVRLEEHLDVLEKVAEAVAFAHDRQVIHRDLKPQNVMLGRFGEVSLLDWGLALALPGGDPRLPSIASSRRPAGTPTYMAPEQLAEDERTCGTGTDVYLLGAILYRLLVGEGPHVGPSVAAILDQVRANRPPIPAAVDQDAARLLRRCLADDPEERPSAETFLAELRRYRRLAGARLLLEQALDERDAALDAVEANDTAQVVAHMSAVRFALEAASTTGADVGAEVHHDTVVPVLERLLEQGDSRTAAQLVAQFPATPPAVHEAVAMAERARNEEEERVASLAGQLDPRRGVRTRLFVGMTTVCTWTVAPIAFWVWELRHAPVSYGVLISGSLLFTLGSVAFSSWARDSLSLSLPNRVTAFALPLASAILPLTLIRGWLVGIDPHEAMVYAQVGWLALGFMAIPVFGWEMVFVGLSHVVGLAATAVRPDLVWLAIAFSDTCFGLAIVVPRREEAMAEVRAWWAGT